MLPLLLLACTADEPSSPASTGDTGPTGPSVCEPTDNALRFDCPLATPGTVAWWPEDDPSDLREAEGTDVVRIWGLRPDVNTVVRFPDGTEALQAPGPLPESIDGVQSEVHGSLGTWVLTTSACNGRALVVLDPLGRIRWYAELARKVLGFDVTPTGTALAMIGGGELLELDHDGTIVWSATNETGHPIHHDLARDEAGYTYVLAAATYTIRDVVYVLDQLLVYDGAGIHVATWELVDHLPDIYEPTDNNGYWNVQFPGAVDFSHGNSVEVSPDGSLLLSLRWLDTLVALEGVGPDFGTPRWWLSVEAVPSDYTIEGEVFDGQHHATLDADGVLRLFDNRLAPNPSRALAYRLGDGVATLEGSWEMGAYCPVQGSAYPLADGSMLLTCASAQRIERFDPAGGVSSVDLSCGPGGGAILARAIPIGW
jgi:hypothetical protein